jgi:hypothetical protein
MEIMEMTPPVDDDELTAAALASDPDAVVPDDAVPFAVFTGTGTPGALPVWYMPAPMRPRAVRGWRRILLRGNVALIIAAFVTINAAGLCNTYGQLHL